MTTAPRKNGLLLIPGDERPKRIQIFAAAAMAGRGRRRELA